MKHSAHSQNHTLLIWLKTVWEAARCEVLRLNSHPVYGSVYELTARLKLPSVLIIDLYHRCDPACGQNEVAKANGD